MAAVTQSRRATTIVPLNDGSMSADNARESIRSTKLRAKRPPTPKIPKSNKRVLDEVQNERDITPKRARRQIPLKFSDTAEQDQSVLHLDDLLEAAMEPEQSEGDARIAALEQHEVAFDQTTIRSSPRLSQSIRRPRNTSPFKFRKHGQDIAVVPIKNSAPSQSRTRRKLLISDFAEPRSEFDSIVEGEDFSMVSLSSVPSAQQHLSQKKEPEQPRPAASSNAETRTRVSSSPRKSARSSPTITGRTGGFKGQYAGRRAGIPAIPSDDTMLLTPFRKFAHSSANVGDQSQQLSRPVFQLNPIVSVRDDEGKEASLPENPPQKLCDQYNTAQYDEEVEVSNDIRYPNLGPTTLNLHAGPVSSLPIQQALDLNDDQLQEDMPLSNSGSTDNDDQQDFVHDPGLISDDSVIINRDLDNEDEIRNSLDEADKPDFVHHQTEQRTAHEHEHEHQNKEGSSMLYLPQNGPTPLKAYSSPLLPDLPAPNMADRPIPKAKVPTPKLSRVVNAGKALQDAVEPSFSGSSSLRNSIEPQRENPFSGFSVASRRELRAGLRLGEELAQRQASMLDITMASASSKIGPSAVTAPSTPPQHRTFQQTGDMPDGMSYPSLEVGRATKVLSQNLHSDTSAEKLDARSLVFDVHHMDDGVHPIRQPVETYHRSSSQQILEENAELENDNSEIEGHYGPTDANYDPNDAFAGNSPDPELRGETDVWQMEARSASGVRSSIEGRQSPLQQQPAMLSSPDAVERLQAESLEYDEKIEDDEFDRDMPRLHDFNEEEAAMSSRIHTPAKLSGVFTPSDSASSPAPRKQRKDPEFTDFTGFTQDLLQAARRQPARSREQITEEAQVERTPDWKATQRNPNADEFTTRSFLDTSAASYKSPRKLLSARKPISLRPVNRKASWLLDPTRARKPPSPPKRASWLPPPVTPSESSSPASRAEDEDNRATNAKALSNVSAEREILSDHEIMKSLIRPSVENPIEDRKTPSPQPLDSSPLSIFVAAQKKKAAEQAKIRAEAQIPKPAPSPTKQVKFAKDVQTAQSHPRLVAVQEKKKPASASPSSRIRLSKPVLQHTNHSSRPSTSESASSAATSKCTSQQSSFVSNGSSNTSYTHDDTQLTWLSFLISAATPLLSSGKALRNFAVSAIQQSRQETFYPSRMSKSNKPAILTTHLPFNDAHWQVLREIHIAALQKPQKFPLNLHSHSADYLGLEIESLGWKRELKEWELAVVERFLLLLDKDGIEQDATQDPIDVEDVIKRVFSLWVGMVTRGELDLTEGKAGAWDRRFVSKREEVLNGQQAWINSHV